MSGNSSTHSSAERPSSSRIASIISGSSNHGGGGGSHNHKASSLFGPLLDMKNGNKDKDANGSAPGSPASLAAAAAAVTAADVRALAIVGSNGAPSKKKMLDLKLLQSGTSLAVRLKKQAPFTPSPSEFRARERQDLAGECCFRDAEAGAGWKGLPHVYVAVCVHSNASTLLALCKYPRPRP